MPTFICCLSNAGGSPPDQMCQSTPESRRDSLSNAPKYSQSLFSEKRISSSECLTNGTEPHVFFSVARRTPAPGINGSMYTGPLHSRNSIAASGCSNCHRFCCSTLWRRSSSSDDPAASPRILPLILSMRMQYAVKKTSGSPPACRSESHWEQACWQLRASGATVLRMDACVPPAAPRLQPYSWHVNAAEAANATAEKCITRAHHYCY